MDFYSHLVNRDENQGDGKNTAVQFREKFLAELGNHEWWRDTSKKIKLNFKDVETLGPSWANEAFAYFTVFDIKPDVFFEKVVCEDISQVKKTIIQIELEAGYKK